jgi:hypothetical protein
MLRRSLILAALAAVLSFGSVRAGLDVPPSANSGMVLPMPFVRSGDPYFLAAGTAPRQYEVSQPPGTTSYRFVNPCEVDIRIKTVASKTESVTATTGTRFLARSSETLASTVPLSNPRIVSIMTVSDPGPAGCVTELQYGNGT